MVRLVWTPSADRHGVAHEDAAHAMTEGRQWFVARFDVSRVEGAPGADDDEQPTAEQFVAPWLPELEETARGRGRPSLSGAGRSPCRRVRLPADLDARLAARAAAEGRPVSAIMRDAMTDYLRAG